MLYQAVKIKDNPTNQKHYVILKKLSKLLLLSSASSGKTGSLYLNYAILVDYML